MITINNINAYNSNYKTSFQGNTQRRKLSNKEKLSLAPNDRKISFSEGKNLLLKGFALQAFGMVNSIIEHPLQTAALIGGTSLGLMALPLIGIPSAVGGSILALGFAGYATGKTIYNCVLFSQNNHKGSYQTARMHLQKIGENTFDLALSAPFAPKAAAQVKTFSQYGKFGINNNLIYKIKSAKFFEKLKTLTKHDKELLRSINYQKATEEELSLLTILKEADKDGIRQKLLDFNVHPDDIPQVVLNKYAEIKGIKTQPDLKYESFPSNTYGYAVADNCSIKINDFKQKFKNKAFDNYQELSMIEDGENFLITYKEKSSGKLITETIKKDVLFAYNLLVSEYAKLAPEAKKILTTVHEREHINQYAQIISKKGYEWIKHAIKPRGKELFDQMIREMPKIDSHSSLAMQVESYLLGATSKTPAGYIKQPIEIGARKVETQALNNSIFRMLNNIFKKVNNNIGTPIEKNILLNDVRFESANT